MENKTEEYLLKVKDKNYIKIIKSGKRGHKVIKECDWCKKIIEIPLYRLIDYRNNFCCKNCKDSHHSLDYRQNKVKNWKNGIGSGTISNKSLSVKKIIDKCESCGITKKELGKRMYIHHIDKNRLNSDVSNLIVLCPRCHAKIHNRITHIKWMNNRGINTK